MHQANINFRTLYQSPFSIAATDESHHIFVNQIKGILCEGIERNLSLDEVRERIEQAVSEKHR